MNEINVTVLLVVHNAEKYISACIKSVLGQTYKTFEFLIVDDGSTDGTVKKIKKFLDNRIRLILNTHDYIKSLNTGIAQAKGEFIARIDADDKMDPNRIEKQVEVMIAFPNVDVCCTWAKTFGRVSYLISRGHGIVNNPIAELLRGNFVCHPSTMLRKSFFRKHNIVYKNYEYAEDYKLWSDVALHGGVFYVLPISLTYYRLSEQQVSCKHHQLQHTTALKIHNEILLNILNDKNNVAHDELQMIYKYLEEMNGRHLLGIFDVFEIISFLYKKSAI